MALSKNKFEKARSFIYRNARPIDLALWRYHFENGTKEAVLSALSFYQNEDGGFGHALEPDIWNPNSSPITTGQATVILNDIEYYKKNSGLVMGLLKYIESGKDRIDDKWLFEIESNNHFPHSPWMHWKENIEQNYNPTIMFVGFALLCGDRNSALYKKCKSIAVKAIDSFLEPEAKNNMHEMICYVNFYEYCKTADIADLFRNFNRFEEILIQRVKEEICGDTEKWSTSYVAKPSHFFDRPGSIFYEDNKQIADYECEFIINSMQDDGAYPITWQWNDYPGEFSISENWWKSYILINNMKYLKNFNKL